MVSELHNVRSCCVKVRCGFRCLQLHGPLYAGTARAGSLLRAYLIRSRYTQHAVGMALAQRCVNRDAGSNSGAEAGAAASSSGLRDQQTLVGEANEKVVSKLRSMFEGPFIRSHASSWPAFMVTKLHIRISATLAKVAGA